MGQTATCDAEVNGKADHGDALLETSEVIFRGAARLKIPFAALKKVVAKEGRLTLAWKREPLSLTLSPQAGRGDRMAGRGDRMAAGTLVLDLGAKAEKWAEKIKNPPGRLDKLGVKAGMKVAVWGTLAEADLDELRGRAEVRVGKPRGGEALVFVVAMAPADLERIQVAATKIAREGAVWVIRQKGPKAPITEAESRRAGLAAGLVDTKVASFSATLTAERYVIPVADRR